MAIRDTLEKNISRPFSNAILPSLMQVKIAHPAFTTRKLISENDQEDWDSIQVSFLRTAERIFVKNHNTSQNFVEKILAKNELF